MSKHAATVRVEDLSFVNRLSAVIEELEDVQQCAEDTGWRGVQHKVEAALGDLANALTAARQYETGELEPIE